MPSQAPELRFRPVLRSMGKVMDIGLHSLGMLGGLDLSTYTVTGTPPAPSGHGAPVLGLRNRVEHQFSAQDSLACQYN